MRSYANTLGSHTCLLHSFVAGKATANITVNATEGGVVTGAGEYEIGKGATLTATANDGYKFLGWFIGDELVSEAATFIYTVEADAEIVAKFEALVYYDVTVDATEGGNATGANTNPKYEIRIASIEYIYTRGIVLFLTIFILRI